MAKDQRVQETLRSEIQEVFHETDDEIPIDTLMGMEYLDAVVSGKMGDTDVGCHS